MILMIFIYIDCSVSKDIKFNNLFKIKTIISILDSIQKSFGEYYTPRDKEINF